MHTGFRRFKGGERKTRGVGSALGGEGLRDRTLHGRQKGRSAPAHGGMGRFAGGHRSVMELTGVMGWLARTAVRDNVSHMYPGCSARSGPLPPTASFAGEHLHPSAPSPMGTPVPLSSDPSAHSTAFAACSFSGGHGGTRSPANTVECRAAKLIEAKSRLGEPQGLGTQLGAER